MTSQQRKELTWPLVALAGILAGFLLGIFALIPKDQPEMRSALVGVVVTSSAGIVAAVLRQLDRKIDDQK